MDNNPPAFPVWNRDVYGNMIAIEQGMTLLDYFAGQALSGMLADRYTKECIEKMELQTDAACEFIAKYAYGMADAMLKAREVK